MDLYSLPRSAWIGGREYGIRADFRQVLKILGELNREEFPEFLRWRIALALFYEQAVPEQDEGEAMEYLAAFIACGEDGRPGPKLLDWEADAPMILADVNAVAGKEVRCEAFLHWWTFLGYFHAIGQGQLSTVVSIRDKLRRGKKLEQWERDYTREHPERFRKKRKQTDADKEEQARLKKLLDG